MYISYTFCVCVKYPHSWAKHETLKLPKLKMLNYSSQMDIMA